MASNCTAIHDRLAVILATVTDVASVNDTPEDYETWEAEAILTPSRLPAVHFATESDSGPATTDSDILDSMVVTIRVVVPKKGSGRTRKTAIRDAIISAVYGDATLQGLCNSMVPTGGSDEKAIKQYHRATVQFKIEHEWTP